MSEIITKQQNELAVLIERYSVQDGVHRTAIPALFFIRRSNLTGPNNGVYKPSLCIVAQGAKEVWLEQERFKYDPANYLITSVDLPVTAQVTEASSDIPYLGLRLEFTASEILEILNDSGIGISPKGNAERAMFVGQMELPIMDSIYRLTCLLDSPKDIPFLAPIYTKEILYRLLRGRYGVTLAQIAMEGSGTYGIREAIEQISNNYSKPLRIEELAEIARMSISSFHRHFKEVTAMSPIQFQKQLRLQEARRLLLTESADAADVAFRVGYESPSQFSREYSRMFGFPPRQDMKRLRV
ncbi:AraC family transcriptional regulator [Paenibacillus sp. HWE-109]|uniref:AraC family transcriptional regulator n=1 Tax=Paenibacillus sp. HWE-109 TaxID=1306526 RepID=UPI001EDE6146|nr:AraC family transcriptional regulator [Paenibacillus sp. HWE-109]UKS28268.1 AraC family transcriptional regulator [Paenibacillus sp. HWE-109]